MLVQMQVRPSPLRLLSIEGLRHLLLDIFRESPGVVSPPQLAVELGRDYERLELQALLKNLRGL